MLELVRKSFKQVFTLLLWLIVISSVVAGLCGGYGVSRETDEQVIYALLGGVMGLVAGLLAAIATGGLIATFLKMEEHLQEISEKLDSTCGTYAPRKKTVVQEPPKPSEPFVPPPDPMAEINADARLAALLKEMPLEKLQTLANAKSMREIAEVDADERLKALLKEMPPEKLQAFIDAKTMRC